MYFDQKLRSRWFINLAALLSCTASVALLIPNAFASERIEGEAVYPTASAVVDFSDLAKQNDVVARRPKRISPHRNVRPRINFIPRADSGNTGSPLTGATVLPPLAPSPALTTNFLGALDTGVAIPPDTMGAVGPNHLMVTLNDQVTILNRRGVQLSSVSLNQFWQSLGPFDSGNFDPKVLYDRVNNRWIFVSPADGEESSSAVCIGVSQTPDPTRGWNLYKFDADPADALWADYPSIGFNRKWIAVSFNMFTISGNNARTSRIYVFDKAGLYAGIQPTPKVFEDASGFTQVPAVTMDETVDTLYFVESFSDRTLRINTVTGPVGSEGFNIGTATPTSTQPWSFSGGDIAPQKGSGQGIAVNDYRMQNVVYRNGSLWCTHSVYFPAGGNPNRSAVQWWQINPNGKVIQRALIDDPSGRQFFGFPTIAVNRNNDVMVGYSRFAADQYASANYSFRYANDPLNTLRGDIAYKQGEAPYFKTFGGDENRWGDYSATVVDPANDLSFWTLQEYAAAPLGTQDRWGVWWGMLDLSVPPDGILEVNIDPVTQSDLIAGSGTNIFVSVFDSLPVTNATVTASGNGINLTFTDNGIGADQILADGIYSANLLVPTNLTTLNFNFQVSAPGKTNFQANLTYNIVAVPANDDFVNAFKIPSGGAFGSDIINASNRLATIEQGEPVHAGVASRAASVWWNWSPAVSGSVLIDTSGSGFDSIVAVYTGAKVDSLTPVASANDEGDRKQAYLTFNAVAGVTYRIAVAGATADSTGPIRLRVEPNSAPDLTPPILAVAYPPSGIVTNVDAIEIRGTSFDPQPNSSGVRVVRLDNGGFDPALSVVATGTTTWSVVMPLTEGTNTVQVFAVDFSGNQSKTNLITIYRKAPGITNDFFANAFNGPALSLGLDEISGNNSEATKEIAFNEPNHAGNEGGKSIWFKYVNNSDGILLLSTEGSDFDTLLAVYTGQSVGALTLVASNDDANTSVKFSELTMSVHSNEVYMIAVDGYAGASGDVNLHYSFNPSQVFNLNVSSIGRGTVTPGSANYPVNSTVSLNAIPTDRFSQFLRFTDSAGNVLSTHSPFDVFITGATNVVAVFGVKQFTDDFETHDFSKLPWQSNGWAIRQDPVSSSNTVAGSTASDPDKPESNSLILVTNLDAGIGGFDFKVSSETNYDKLEFFLDGQLQGSWSGEVGWTNFTFQVRSGTARLEWRYSTDTGIINGLNAAFIDNVDLPVRAAGPSLTPGTLSIVRNADKSLSIQIQGQASATYDIQGSSDLSQWVTLANVLANGSGQASFNDAGSAAFQYRFYRAVSK
jgi:hypothetical protein